MNKNLRSVVLWGGAGHGWIQGHCSAHYTCASLGLKRITEEHCTYFIAPSFKSFCSSESSKLYSSIIRHSTRMWAKSLSLFSLPMHLQLHRKEMCPLSNCDLWAISEKSRVFVMEDPHMSPLLRLSSTGPDKIKWRGARATFTKKKVQTSVHIEEAIWMLPCLPFVSIECNSGVSIQKILSHRQRQVNWKFRQPYNCWCKPWVVFGNKYRTYKK